MTRTPIHPGEHLKEELATLGISASELTRQLEVPANRITGILNGDRSVTADTALRLAHWFGSSADFWMNLQKIYDLRGAERSLAKTLPRLKRLNLTKQGIKADPAATPRKRASA